MTKGQPITARELRRSLLRTGELVDHLTFGERDFADIDRETEFFGNELNRNFAHPDLTGERMVAAKAALHRVGEAEQEAFVTAREGLQPHVAAGRKLNGITRQVGGARIAAGSALGLHQPFLAENVGYARHGWRQRFRAKMRRRRRRVSASQSEIEQPMRVVIGRPQHLTTGQVLEGRRDAPPDLHGCGIERSRRAEPRQCRAVGA